MTLVYVGIAFAICGLWLVFVDRVLRERTDRASESLREMKDMLNRQDHDMDRLASTLDKFSATLDRGLNRLGDGDADERGPADDDRRFPSPRRAHRSVAIFRDALRRLSSDKRIIADVFEQSSRPLRYVDIADFVLAFGDAHQIIFEFKTKARETPQYRLIGSSPTDPWKDQVWSETILKMSGMTKLEDLTAGEWSGFYRLRSAEPGGTVSMSSRIIEKWFRAESGVRRDPGLRADIAESA
jgi:hypothetical protein